MNRSTALLFSAAVLALAVLVTFIRGRSERRVDIDTPRANASVETTTALEHRPPPEPTPAPANPPSNDKAPTLAVPQEEGTPQEKTPQRTAANDPALAALRAAKSDLSESGTDALVKALSSNDALLVIEAADGLVARKATRAIPALAKFDVPKSPDAAPAVIEAMGRLGGMAKGGEHATAVARLAALLNEEKGRNAPESRGNLLQIYEALGDTKDPRAAAILEAELREDSVPRAAKNVIVQALARIGSPTSLPVLVELRASLGTAEAIPFEEAIRVELIQAIDEALKTLP